MTSPDSDRKKQQTAFVAIAILALVIVLVFLLMTAFSFSSSRDRELLMLDASTKSETEEQILSSLEAISQELYAIENIIAETSKDVTDELSASMETLSALNLAFLEWAEQEGLITKTER